MYLKIHQLIPTCIVPNFGVLTLQNNSATTN